MHIWGVVRFLLWKCRFLQLTDNTYPYRDKKGERFPAPRCQEMSVRFAVTGENYAALGVANGDRVSFGTAYCDVQMLPLT